MEFLSLNKNGVNVYAGFSNRLETAIVDTLVWIPFAIIVSIPSLFFSPYTI